MPGDLCLGRSSGVTKNSGFTSLLLLRLQLDVPELLLATLSNRTRSYRDLLTRREAHLPGRLKTGSLTIPTLRRYTLSTR